MGGTGCRRGFLSCLACLSFVSILLCKLQSFTPFTLGSEAAPPWVCPKAALGSRPHIGKALGIAGEPAGHGWEGTEPSGWVGFGGGKEEEEAEVKFPAHRKRGISAKRCGSGSIRDMGIWGLDS